MLETWGICVLTTALGVVVLGVLVYLCMRKIRVADLPPQDIGALSEQIVYLMRTRGYIATLEKEGRIDVEKGSWVATILFLRQLPDGRIEILYRAATTLVSWVVLLVLLFTVQIAGLVVAIVLHIMSKNFTIEEVIPDIVRFCSQPQPQPSCPRCGEELKYIRRKQKWYCYHCKRYR